ncbi:furin-like protease 2 isoform X2 [Rhodnius prolixus]|uniref:furin-like protease 2 isoform X2 n=1 Tax=Rhodnius prolixus TaxID=13249 RepID=UPI003D18A79B
MKPTNICLLAFVLLIMTPLSPSYSARSPYIIIRFTVFTNIVEMVTSAGLIFTNEFAVRLEPTADPDAIAARHGFRNLGQIGSLRGYYLFEHPRVHKRSLTPHQQHHKNLKNEPKVEWVKQQEVKRRTKREGLDPWGDDQSTTAPASNYFPDPLYAQQWYLNGGAENGLDMNVAPAWAKGYTGKGVVVSILDDGIQTNHPDLVDNYDPLASSDINDNDMDPMPRDNGDNKHGTRCAGEVAAAAYNTYCGVGVAYNASIGGVRMLDGQVSDAVEARALSLNPHHIDIYSASWGPEDDGKTVDGPGPLATRAFLNGITKGRGGKGSIFVWASGNGGQHTDSCNCDGYTNSIYTLSISSATQAGFKPWYLEECSSTIATTYSSGILGRDKSVASVDMEAKLRPDHLCTLEHTGTSASAPLAAGMCALALEANPNLTWRDMQHIIVMSANPAPLEKEAGWTINGAQRKVSHKFGFGLMDGEAMVNLAEQWTSVPAQHICKTPVIAENRILDKTYSSETKFHTNVTGCEGTESEVRYLEHVQCKITLNFQPRGNLRLVLTSPQGTPSTLLSQRPRDEVSAALNDWPFLSVHFWGEDPRGIWALTVINDGAKKVSANGVFTKWQLIFYGTDTKPVNLRPPSLQMYRKKQDLSDPAFYKKVEGEAGYDDNVVDDAVEVLYNCHLECDSKGCYGPANNQCISCAHYKLNKSCVASCPEEGYYASGGLCLPCHVDCRTCTGPGYHNCLTCAPHLYYITDLALCIHACPHTYYQDVDTKRCISCHETCASCQDGPTLCSSCDSHLVHHSNSCLASCPAGTYLNHHQRCAPCHPSCDTCIGGKITDCLPPSRSATCSDGQCSECPPGLFLQNSTCVSGCDPGWYHIGKSCKRCWPGCLGCYGGRKDECVSCVAGRMLARGQCRLHCPRNMYSTSTGCANCHHFCLTCNGGGAYSCTACSSGRYLDEESGLCYSCHPTCLTCSSAAQNACTSCPQNLILDSGQCISYDDTDGSNCINCIENQDTKIHSFGAGKRRISEAVSWSGIVDEPLQAFHRGKPPEYSPFVTVTVIAVIACLAIVVLFALLFATLQIRSQRSSGAGSARSEIYREKPAPTKSQKASDASGRGGQVI